MKKKFKGQLLTVSFLPIAVSSPPPPSVFSVAQPLPSSSDSPAAAVPSPEVDGEFQLYSSAGPCLFPRLHENGQPGITHQGSDISPIHLGGMNAFKKGHAILMQC